MESHCATLYSPRRLISHNGSEIIIPSSTVCVGVVGLLLLLIVGESFSVQPRWTDSKLGGREFRPLNHILDTVHYQMLLEHYLANGRSAGGGEVVLYFVLPLLLCQQQGIIMSLITLSLCQSLGRRASRRAGGWTSLVFVADSNVANPSPSGDGLPTAPSSS